MYDNQFSGSIPVGIGNLIALQYLILNDNQLCGSIPHELGKLSNLIQLNLSQNQLSGFIPPELGNLTSLKLMQLNNNHLQGHIPATIGDLINLVILRLHDNLLIGAVAESFTNLTALYDPGMAPDGGDGLDLDYNILKVPEDYPDPANPLHVFLLQKDPDWHLRQSAIIHSYLPTIHH